MVRQKRMEIIKKHLILCEGIDAKLFLIHFLNSADLKENASFSEDIQVEDFGGNEDLSNFLGALKNMSGFDEVESIMIVRDAEKDADLAVQQIRSALTRSGLASPEHAGIWVGSEPRIGFLLFPACEKESEAGTLEDLCLRILKEPASSVLLQDVDQFLDDLSQNYDRQFPHRFKTKLHTYFSVTDKFVSLKIGEAAKAGAFDWSNCKLNYLKGFILAGVEDHAVITEQS